MYGCVDKIIQLSLLSIGRSAKNVGRSQYIDELVTKFREQHIVVIDDLLPLSIVEAMREEAKALLETKSQRRQVTIKESGNTPRAYSSTYEGIHRNVPGIVFGTGVSMSLVLDRQELTLQDFHPAVVVGVKQSYRMIDPRYWVCMDDVYYDIDRSRILDISAIKFTLASPNPTEDARKDNQIVLLQKLADGEQAKTDSQRFLELCTKSDSGVAALRIAHLMGLNPIYVVGLGDKVHNGQFYFHTDSVATAVTPRAARI